MNKTKILITGSCGLIGKELLIQLKENKNYKIKEADLKYGNDLRNFNECLKLTKGIDEVYSLVGIKGNPKMTNEKPIDFMGNMLQFDTNMIMAAQMNGVKKFLYTSSIAVENPETDKYPAWAKKTAEILIEAMRIQYPNGTKYCIVRPANVYGRFDDFDKENLMVISDLIRKALKSNVLEIWGDGTQIRDFINAKDVACGMIKCMQKMPKVPINLCSGIGVTIKQVVEAIREHINKDIEIKYNMIKQGEKSRLMQPNGQIVGFKPEIDLNSGIKEVIECQKNLKH